MNKTAAAFAVLMLAAAGFAAGAQRDGAVIRNSGSTNFSGYTITVHSDGSASSVRSTRTGQAAGSPVSGTIPASLAAQFFTDLRTAKHSGRIVAQTCMKSASFGSTMVVTYHGWTTPDLTCPGDGFVVALGADANKIATALGIAQQPRRIPMLPNERRRPVPAPGQASASPEPAPSAS